MTKSVPHALIVPAALCFRGAVAVSGLISLMLAWVGNCVASANTGTPIASVQTAVEVAPWTTPVMDYTLTASFNQSGTKWSGKHSGQDFAVPVGTSVMAASGGIVVKAGPNGGGDGSSYGNAIVIEHANDIYSQYAHLSEIDVHVGQTVHSGQVIALSGDTGNSSGPHLHFEIRTSPSYGSALDPAAFLRSQGVRI